MDIPHTTLDCFKQSYSDPSDSIREILKYWLDTAVDPRPSWEAVITALRSPIVDKKSVAGQLESKYCTPVRQKMKESNSPNDMEHGKGMGVRVGGREVSLKNVFISELQYYLYLLQIFMIRVMLASCQLLN